MFAYLRTIVESDSDCSDPKIVLTPLSAQDMFAYLRTIVESDSGCSDPKIVLTPLSAPPIARLGGGRAGKVECPLLFFRPRRTCESRDRPRIEPFDEWPIRFLVTAPKERNSPSPGQRPGNREHDSRVSAQRADDSANRWPVGPPASLATPPFPRALPRAGRAAGPPAPRSAARFLFSPYRAADRAISKEERCRFHPGTTRRGFAASIPPGYVRICANDCQVFSAVVWS